MQNLDEFYTKKYQEDVGCGCGYKLAYFDDKFSEFFNSNLGEDAIYNFINSAIK